MYYFKRLSCWDCPVPAKCSWMLRKILNYRSVVDGIGGWGTVVKGTCYSIAKMYSCLRPQVPKVEWRRVICNNSASPRSLFITWLAVQNRLSTKDRMILWHLQCDPTCVLCQKENENVQHLFFQCDFARHLKLINSSSFHIIAIKPVDSCLLY